MFTSDNLIEKYRNAISSHRREGSNKFFRWFAAGSTPDKAFAHAEKTWDVCIKPFLPKVLGKSLDIGYGGGGLVLCAGRVFEHTYGTDIHRESAFVVGELGSRGCFNSTLWESDGRELPFPDESMDFVYSWTVFMHLLKIDVVVDYIKEIARILSPEGRALIYWSRLLRSGVGVEDWERDIETEKLDEIGYVEKETEGVNSVNLRIAMWWFEREVEKNGLVPIQRTVSGWVQNGFRRADGQHGLIFGRK